MKLNIFCTTFNMARSHQEIDFDILMPHPKEYNLIIWGA